jgi:outer membrane immunogenic protein
MFWGIVMKKLLLAGVCLTAWVGSAVAADMAVKAPVYTPSYSWTGCYGGFNFGSLFAKKDWTIGGSFESSYDVTDLLIGGQLGCNYQFGTWVLGIQGDYDWINATGTGAGQFTGLTDRTHITSLSSVTGRFGYALDRWLPYVRAGGAWEHAKFDAFDANNAVVGTASGTRSGFTVGGGLEYAIVSNLSIFIEYNWYDFGTRTTTFTGVFPTTNIRERDSAVKVGLNWKFLPW